MVLHCDVCGSTYRVDRYTFTISKPDFRVLDCKLTVLMIRAVDLCDHHFLKFKEKLESRTFGLLIRDLLTEKKLTKEEVERKEQIEKDKLRFVK